MEITSSKILKISRSTNKEKERTEKRLDYIDVAKFLGVFIIVFTHSMGSKTLLLSFLCSFQIFCFFFLSGLTIKTYEDDFSKFLIKKIKGLIVPMLFYGILMISLSIPVIKANGYAVEDYYFVNSFFKIISTN